MIWFIVEVGSNIVCHQFRDCSPDYAEVQKKFFRENGTPVLAVVRPKPRGREFSSGVYVATHWTQALPGKTRRVSKRILDSP